MPRNETTQKNTPSCVLTLLTACVMAPSVPSRIRGNEYPRRTRTRTIHQNVLGHKSWTLNERIHLAYLKYSARHHVLLVLLLVPRLFDQLITIQISLAITSFSVGEFCWQPTLSKNPDCPKVLTSIGVGGWGCQLWTNCVPLVPLLQLCSRPVHYSMYK